MVGRSLVFRAYQASQCPLYIRQKGSSQNKSLFPEVKAEYQCDLMLNHIILHLVIDRFTGSNNICNRPSCRMRHYLA